METKEQYEIITKKKPEFKPIDLLRVPHKQNDLVVAYPAFGSNYFNNNVAEMQKSYSHPQTGERISFREPTTSESISAAAYDFENLTKPRFLYPSWLQAGRIVRTSEGVFANPPKDEKGNLIVNEKILKSYLNGVNPLKVGKGKIYIVSDTENLRDFGFADYDSFERGVQNRDTFSQGGLARVLEHVKEEAKNLKTIVSRKFRESELSVGGFDNVKEPALSVVSMNSGWVLAEDRLLVYCDCWTNCKYGFAFGVLDKGSEGVAKK